VGVILIPPPPLLGDKEEVERNFCSPRGAGSDDGVDPRDCRLLATPPLPPPRNTLPRNEVRLPSSESASNALELDGGGGGGGYGVRWGWLNFPGLIGCSPFGSSGVGTRHLLDARRSERLPGFRLTEDVEEEWGGGGEENGEVWSCPPPPAITCPMGLVSHVRLRCLNKGDDGGSTSTRLGADNEARGLHLAVSLPLAGCGTTVAELFLDDPQELLLLLWR
jgi:hypothetical protein